MAATRTYNFRDRSKRPNYNEDQDRCAMYIEPEDVESDDGDADFVPSKDDDDIKITISRKNRRKAPVPPVEKKTYVPNQELPDTPSKPQTFAELFQLSQHIKDTGKMYVNCQKLPEVHHLLEEMNSWIGLESVKNTVAKFMMVELKKISLKLSKQEDTSSQHPDQKNGYWKHMVVTGPPGVGKTMIAKMVASFYSCLDEARSDEVVFGTSRNMISDFQGQTKSMVEALVMQTLGKSGILFIDEAPSLNIENNCPYGKIAIKTLMELMDLHRSELIVIFAGYRPEMEQNIMGADPGMRRRIQWWFDIEPYSPKEMYLIYQKLVQDMRQTLCAEDFVNEEWMNQHYKYFPFYGGSVRNFVEKIMYLHHVSSFGSSASNEIQVESIRGGFDLYKSFCLDPDYREELEHPERFAEKEEEEQQQQLSPLQAHVLRDPRMLYPFLLPSLGGVSTFLNRSSP